MVLEDETPSQSSTRPAAAGKTLTTADCQADLATAVDGGSGIICVDMPSQRIHVVPPITVAAIVTLNTASECVCDVSCWQIAPTLFFSNSISSHRKVASAFVLKVSILCGVQ